MKKIITIEKRNIGEGYPPFILAEMSGNHNQSIERAFSIIESAAKCGCDGIKLQTYTPDTITLDIKEREFVVNDTNSLWYGESLYDLYGKAMTPWEWHKPLFDKCKELGLICFSTPFDETSVDFLEELNPPAYKIASFENIDMPLLKKVASLGKPVIMSTGMSTISELDESVQTLKDNGCKDIILLKCTSSYPASPENSNLTTIPHMRDLFDLQIGLSDHTLGIGASIASVALGASFIEKHFTLSRQEGGVDSAFSMEPHEMKMLVEESKRAWEAIGEIDYGGSEAEKPLRQFRRSIYIAEDMKEGEIFSKVNLRSIRPGLGLEPKFYEMLLGKKINKNARKGTPMNWDLLG